MSACVKAAQRPPVVGKPCRARVDGGACGCVERYASNGACVDCHRRRMRVPEAARPHPPKKVAFSPVPSAGQPFPYPVLSARLLATLPASLGQKFLVTGEGWNSVATPCLWLWEEARGENLKVGDRGFLVWEVRPNILPGVANWYFKKEVETQDGTPVHRP